MICCDTCLDWYHGKCVGITKAMGKDMEAAGNEWRCPKCKKETENAKEAKVEFFNYTFCSALAQSTLEFFKLSLSLT